MKLFRVLAIMDDDSDNELTFHMIAEDITRASKEASLQLPGDFVIRNITMISDACGATGIDQNGKSVTCLFDEEIFNVR
ncbi:MAG: hypothetical protein K0U41_08765 [Gammaproteobacteria bacterium]|nr:hypothetical protein [Gammaproteobacteria bacterium]